MTAQLSDILVATHALATIFMTGLIWFVQIVHYPLMAQVGAEHYRDYQLAHESRTGLVVIGPMLVELGCAVALLWTAVPTSLSGTGLGALGLVWGSTFLLQVPCHNKLRAGLDQAIVERLVRTNWIRTIGWSARAAIALVMLTQH